MSDDVAERLRKRAYRLAAKDFNGDGAKLAMEAADELTRLRAENERLREALRPFSDAASTDDYIDDVEVAETDTARKITFGDLRRARAALDGVTEPTSPWRDIESAPKDGTKILAFARGHTDYYGVAEWAEADSNLNRPIGVWIWDFLIRPTHWMPLSEPPK